MPFSISGPRLMQMATNDLMSFHLLIYVLTIECLRGFNIKSKGFVNVHEMYTDSYGYGVPICRQ